MNRTPKDFAIEFGGYLAKGAENFIKVLHAEDEARMQHEEKGDSETEKALEQAQQSRGELLSGLLGHIYEFRKRAERAAATDQGNAGVLPQAWRAVTMADQREGLVGKQVLAFDGQVTTVKLVDFAGNVHCDNGRQYMLRQLQVSKHSAAVGALPAQQARDKALQDLRAAGYAVVLFGPEELNGVQPETVEARLVEEGNGVIRFLKPAASRERA